MSAPYLIAVAVKSSVLLAAGLISVRLSRNADAGLRHSICVLSLTGAMCTLVLSAWTPQWSVPIPISAVAAQPFQWPMVLTAAWAIGAAMMLLRWIGGLSALRLACRRSAFLQNYEGIEVRSGGVSVPLTCGVFRPLVLLPQSAREWDALRLRAVLLHELAHVRRRDCLAKYLTQWSRVALWWNPLVGMLASRMEQEQERACDEVVLSSGVAPDAYAKALLDTARECSNPLLLGCAMSSTSELRARLEHLFVWRPGIEHKTRRAALAIPLLLALMTGVSCAGKRMPQAEIPAGVSVVPVAPAMTIPQARQRHP